MNGTAPQNCVARSAGSARRGSRSKGEGALASRDHTTLSRIPTSENLVRAKFAESWLYEVRRITLPRTPFNRDRYGVARPRFGREDSRMAVLRIDDLLANA